MYNLVHLTLVYNALRCAQANPNALEITGLQVSVEEGLYDPNGDDDPATGVSCSATIPLVVTLTSSAGLMLATFVNVTAIRRVYRYLVRIAYCMTASPPVGGASRKLLVKLAGTIDGTNCTRAAAVVSCDCASDCGSGHHFTAGDLLRNVRRPASYSHPARLSGFLTSRGDFRTYVSSPDERLDLTARREHWRT